MQKRTMLAVSAITPLLTKGLLACAALIAAGCASGALEDNSFQQGWRRATVLELAPAQATLASHVQADCRKEWPAGAWPSQVAAVSYSWGGSANLRTLRSVAVPEGVTLKVGDVVRVQVRDCQAALVVHD
jgi:hypothetical protein